MPPRRRKSPERPTSSKSLEGSRLYAGNVKERAPAVALPSVNQSPTRRVSFAPTLPSMRMSQEIGDTRISLKTLLNAIKTMEGRLEGKIDILASRPLPSEESSRLLKQDSVSEEHTLHLKETSGLLNNLEHRNNLDTLIRVTHTSHSLPIHLLWECGLVPHLAVMNTASVLWMCVFLCCLLRFLHVRSQECCGIWYELSKVKIILLRLFLLHC